ncbi:hypothetical protein R5R35_007312 [Gryllus longicercus]|uniref:RETREG1-3/ARL6IP-like N-terminal reticulon-homology domain-containing protein n=1 Tax=Gryllus longicercus TaxID=2509291 RepID=A0AAN9Z6H8_9ORTH
MAGRLMDWISRIKNWSFSRKGQHQSSDNGDVSNEDNLVRALGHFEPYVMKAQSILVWENPFISVCSVILVNILFGLAISFEIRFYGLIFTMLLCLFIIDLCIEKVWPEITSRPCSTTEDHQAGHSRVLTVPEISRYVSQAREVLKDYYVWLKNLRDDQPGMFCCAMCLLFALLTFIGRTVPGAVIGYFLLMLVMAGPGICIHVLPPTFKQRVSNFQAALRSKEKGPLGDLWKRCLCIIQCFLAGEMDSEVEEYLPEQSCETLALLQQATEPVDEEQREESLIVEEFGLDLDTADASILGHDDGSTDGLDMSEFDLSAPPSLGGSTTNSHTNNSNHHLPAQAAIPRGGLRRRHDLTVDDSDSDDEVGDGIHFQSHHFNQDSSEEEEQAFVQGLVFSEPVSSTASGTTTNSTQAAPSTSLGEMLTSSAANIVSKNICNLAALHSSVISSVINAAVVKVSAQQMPQQEQVAKGQKGTRDTNRDDSSSSGGESEFEMISHNDLT